MKSFIRRKSSKSSVKTPVAVQQVAAVPPRIPSPSPLPSPVPEQAPPLYARFARGDVVPDFREEPKAPAVANTELKRPRALGSGFRSSSVDEELSVVKKTAGSTRSGLSIRTTSSRPLSPPTSPAPILPRPPTPPPPSPVKPSLGRSAPSPRKSVSVPVPVPAPTRPVTPPAPLTPPSAPFTSPRRAYSPLAAFGPPPKVAKSTPAPVVQRAASPVPVPVAPPSPQSPAKNLASPVQELQSPPQELHLHAPDSPLPKRSPEFGPGLASQLRAASRSGTRDGVSPSRPSTASSPTARTDMASSVARPSTGSSIPRPSTGSSTPGSVSGYFALYPDRAVENDRGRTKARGGLLSPESSEDGHGRREVVHENGNGHVSAHENTNGNGHASTPVSAPAPAHENGSANGQAPIQNEKETPDPPVKRSRGSASARMQERQARWAGVAVGSAGASVGRRRSPVPVSGEGVARSRSRPRDETPSKPSTPVAATPLPSGLPTQPSTTASTLSNAAFPPSTGTSTNQSTPKPDDDLQAFAASLPATFASGLPVADGAFGEVSKRVPKGARLSQLGGVGVTSPSPSLDTPPAQSPHPPSLEHKHSSDAQSMHSTHSHSSHSSKHISGGGVETQREGRWRPKSRDTDLPKSEKERDKSRGRDKESGDETKRSSSRKLRKPVENIAIPPPPEEKETRRLKRPGTPTSAGGGGNGNGNGNFAGVGAGGGRVGNGHARKGSAFELDADPFAKLEPAVPVKVEDEEMGYAPPPRTTSATSLPSTSTSTSSGANTPTSTTTPNTSTPTLTRHPSTLPTPITPAEAAARLLQREIKPPLDTSLPPSVLHPRVPISPHRERAGSPVKLVSTSTPAATPTALIPAILPSGTYPLHRHITHPFLLFSLLQYLAYADFTALLTLDKGAFRALSEVRDLREEVLERYLRTVGYSRWVWPAKEGIVLSLKDLNAYLRGVSTPMHEYATVADAYIAQSPDGVPSSRVLRAFAASCRSFTRLVLRLRLQAEASARAYPTSPPPSATGTGTQSKRSSVQTVARRDSAAMSAASHGESVFSSSSHGHDDVNANGNVPQVGTPKRFASPLFRLNHAPLLRLFVPSPNGAWLSDESVVECEKELKRAGVLHVLRAGDVVWDTAVLDEGNAGRLIWDGNYLIDLDYNYSPGGELPRYMHSLSFPPSYFHKVIRSAGHPLCQIDISPWGAEVARNLQLVQDRVVTETPQGSHHTVLRWSHRTRFYVHAGQPIPNSDGAIVDAKWAGAIVIEAEGTNEGLADLVGRCGEAAAAGLNVAGGLASGAGTGDAGRVFRLLRDRSRPGEIWLRCVRDKERIA